MAEKAAKAPPSQNQKAPSAPDLRALENAYQMVGELHASDGVRHFIGRRRHDGADVIVSVYMPPTGGENNELTHFAADAQQLANGLRDPHVVDIYEARWLGSNALAVVGERAAGITLDELLERGEEFSNPRVAAALKDVAGALEWARTHDIVHRGVTPESMFFDEADERVRVAFVPMPIPLTGAADAQGDAKTIGKLAWAMLTGKHYDQSDRLSELTPNLATRVVDVVERLVRSKLGAPPVDVPTAIGIIAAGDVLKQAEVEIAAMKEEYQEQHRAALAKCETHRMEVEQQAAEAAAALGDERADLHRQIAEKQSDFARERSEFDRVMAERQQQLAAIRAELEAQAETLDARLVDFDARRSEFEAIVRERQRELAAVKKGEKAPAPSPQFNAFAKRKKEKAPKSVRGVFAPLDKPPKAKDESKLKRWALPLGFGLVGAAVAGAIITIHVHNANHDENAVRFGNTTTAPRSNMPDGQSRGGFMSQSAGGTLVPQPSTSPYARPGDSVAVPKPDTTTVADTAKPRPKPKDVDPREGLAAPPSAVVPREPIRRDTIVDTLPAREPMPIRDTTSRSETTVPRDTSRPDTVRRDTMVGRDKFSRRDTMRAGVTSTIVRRDSIVRSDTTIIKRDTIRVRPDSIIR